MMIILEVLSILITSRYYVLSEYTIGRDRIMGPEFILQSSLISVT